MKIKTGYKSKLKYYSTFASLSNIKVFKQIVVLNKRLHTSEIVSSFLFTMIAKLILLS